MVPPSTTVFPLIESTVPAAPPCSHKRRQSTSHFLHSLTAIFKIHNHDPRNDTRRSFPSRFRHPRGTTSHDNLIAAMGLDQLTTTDNLGSIVEQLHSFPPLPPRSIEDKPKVEDGQVIVNVQTLKEEEKVEPKADVKAKEALENSEGALADDEEIYGEDKEYDDDEYFEDLTEEAIEQLANEHKEEMAKLESELKVGRTKVKFWDFDEVKAMMITLLLFFEARQGQPNSMNRDIFDEVESMDQRGEPKEIEVMREVPQAEAYYRHLLGVALGPRVGKITEAFEKGTTGWQSSYDQRHYPCSRHLYSTLPPGHRLYFSHAHGLGYPTISCTSAVSRNFGKAFLAHDAVDASWIIDSSTTDHMTYNFDLFSTILLSHRDHVLTTNNPTAPITKVGSILLTPILPLDEVLLVPSLSGNLLSVPQVTEQLNCVVLMYPSIVLLHDIQTLEIFGHGTKMDVLHETTCPQTPQHNEVAKCKNGHIIATAHALPLGEATVEPVEPTVLDETTDLEETPALAKTTTLAKFEPASFIDGAKPIPPPASQIVPYQAPLDIPEVSTSIPPPASQIVIA
ncbi:hypothetical protein L3X38_036402 [Prunus dulcis]|uniref:Retrovirus-related Pol polyprotein from transposon TNT 1-94-like beta-barrel domain-containing protein n=1 Tax=Prunus dulcis TaxID=3755 RepID=A0AAD4V157_PRUDU|nr:hypothetical protein L3X38_036402 [Prunus dulcis]